MENLPDPRQFKHLSLEDERKGIGVEIVLEVEDINKEYEYIQTTKYPIAEELKKQDWGLTDFRVIDPNDYYLRITSKL